MRTLLFILVLSLVTACVPHNTAPAPVPCTVMQVQQAYERERAAAEAQALDELTALAVQNKPVDQRRDYWTRKLKRIDAAYRQELARVARQCGPAMTIDSAPRRVS